MTEKAKVSIEVHPAALLFPMMADDELNKLADDIAANGLMEPIVIYQGQILDGRNRLAACELSDVEPRFSEVTDIPSPTVYVLSKNLHRRHLSISQCGAIGAEAVPLLKEEAKKRQGQRTDLSESTSGSLEPEVHGKATAIAAKELGIGDETVKRALKVKRENPELFERIKKGEITARAAANSLRTAGSSTKDHRPKEERISQIRKLAGKGYHDTQIAKEIGVSAARVRDLASEANISLPHHSIGNRHRINVNRVIQETVIAAEGFTSTIDLLADRTGELDTSKVTDWIESLESARITLGKIIRILKGVRQQ